MALKYAIPIITATTILMNVYFAYAGIGATVRCDVVQTANAIYATLTE